MTSHKTNNTHEKGNAVTLTLLGLSVAILAGVIVLYFIGKAKPMPVYTIPEPVDEDLFVEEKAEAKNPREGWRTYTSEEYNFSFEYPPGWIVATGTLSTGDPAITTHPANGTMSVYSHQDVATHVSFYPLGVATEGVRAVEKPSDVLIEVPQASATDYILKSGRPWATKAIFEQYPQSWNDSGFIFARLLIEEEELVYMRGGTEIQQYEFDPITGDHIERNGFVDTNMRETEEFVLLSFAFLESDGTVTEYNEFSVIVDEPQENQLLTSPQTVRGQIPGDWYFGEEYPIRLETAAGDTVTESFITGLEGWDSGAYIPFEVSLVFENPTATSGALIIGRDDTENTETKLIIPVLFNKSE
jgi:hypothetical protein